MNLNKSNRSLLYHLDSNARLGFSELGKLLGVSEGAVRYRYECLVEEGVILSAYPVVDVGRVGYSVHKVLCKLAGASEQDLRTMLTTLKKHDKVNWVARFDGQYDLGCTVFVKHLGEVAQFVDSFRSKFFSKIRHIAYAVNLQGEFFPRDYLIRLDRPNNNAATYRSFAEEGLSEKEQWNSDEYIGIVRCLARDVRLSVASIARELSLSSETVRKRLARLESSKIIAGYRLALDNSKIGRESFYLLLSIQPVAEKRLSAFVKFLRETPEVVYLIRMLGGWDFDVSIEVKDGAHYRQFIGKLLELFPDVIKDVQTLTTWQVVKFGIVPPSF